MLTERAGLDSLEALIVWANEHSIRDIQLDQMLQFGRDIFGALVVHTERVMIEWNSVLGPNTILAYH
jgi:hypothetical protein